MTLPWTNPERLQAVHDDGRVARVEPILGLWPSPKTGNYGLSIEGLPFYFQDNGLMNTGGDYWRGVMNTGGNRWRIEAKPDDAEHAHCKRMLLDILATIHRDGGHRTDELGLEHSYIEATHLAAAAVQGLEELAAERAAHEATKREAEAFRREVSKACNEAWDLDNFGRQQVMKHLSRFILPDPVPVVDPLVEIMRERGVGQTVRNEILRDMAKRGLTLSKEPEQ